MFEIIKAGGLLMLPIVVCSVLAMAIVIERFVTLQKRKVAPNNLLQQVWKWVNEKQLSEQRVRELQRGSPLGRILAAGLLNRNQSREIMKDSIEEVGRAVAYDLERYLSALGTVAAITPLLGLLGTVVGMISVFTNITTVGVGNPSALAGGISQALVTTAAGLGVAIPALIFHRYFRRRVDGLVVEMEQEALKLVEVLQHHRVLEARQRTGGGAH